MNRKLPALVLGLIVVMATISAPTNSDQPSNYSPSKKDYDFIPVIPASTPMQTLVAFPDNQTLKPIPKLAPKLTSKPTPKPVSPYYKVKYGIASTYGPGYDELLALPEGRGIKVEVCGPAGCIIRMSNDAGPDLTMQRAGRVIDLNLNDFRLIGGSYKLGLIKDVRVRYFR